MSVALALFGGCGGGAREGAPERVEAIPSAPADVVPDIPTLPDADALTQTATLRRVTTLRTRLDGPPLPDLGACVPATSVWIAERRDSSARVLFRNDDVDLFAWVPQADLTDDVGTPPTTPEPADDVAGRELESQTRLYDEAGTLVGRVRRETTLAVGDDGQLRVPTPCGSVTVRALGFASP